MTNHHEQPSSEASVDKIHHQEIIPPEKCREKIEPLFSPDLDEEIKRDIIESLFISMILEYCPTIDEGAIGIVIDLSAESIPAGLREHFELIIPELKGNESRPEAQYGIAAKILKIYLNGREAVEFNLQKTAYELFNDSSLKNSAVRIPKPLAHRHFRVESEEVRHEFRQKGISVTAQHPEIGFLVMDKVPGITLRNHLYQQVLLDQKEILNKTWPGKNQSEQKILLASISEIDLRQMIEGLWGQREETELDGLAIEYLRGKPNILPKEQVEQVAQVIDYLNNQGFYHRDLHLKNLMLGRDGNIYIIDFDRSVQLPRDMIGQTDAYILREEVYNKTDNRGYYHDGTMISQLQKLFQERPDQSLAQLDEARGELGRHLRLRPNFQHAYEKMWQQLATGVSNVDQASENFVTQTDNYRWKNEHLYLKLKVACLSEIWEKSPERHDEIKAFCVERLESSQNNIELKLYGDLLRKIGAQ